MMAKRLTTLAKQDAKSIVSGKFGKLGALTILGGLITTIPVFIIMFMNVIDIISSALTSDISGLLMSIVSLILASVLITSPLAFGQIKCFYDVYKTGDFQWKTLFIAFETLDSYKRALKYSVLIGAKLVLWAIPFAIALYAAFIQFVFVMFGYNVYGEIIPTALIITLIMAIISIILLLIIVIKSMKYCAGYLTLIDNKEIGCKGAVSEGLQIFKGYNKELIYFVCSFILWQILSAITYGVAAFFTAPYLTISFIVLVRKIECEKAEKQLEKMQDEQGLSHIDIIEDISITGVEDSTNAVDKELELVNEKLENIDNRDN